MTIVPITASTSDFDADFKAAVRMNRLGLSEGRSSVFKVQNFTNYSLNEKQTMFEYLLTTFKSSLDEISMLEQEINNLKNTLLEKHDIINARLDLEEELRTHKIVYQKQILDLNKEKEDFKKKSEYYEKICKSWCISSRKINDCIDRQIPGQIRAVLGEHFILANQLDYNNDPERFKSSILPGALPMM